MLTLTKSGAPEFAENLQSLAPHTLFSDHAVIQRDAPVLIFGTGAQPGGMVDVVFAGTAESCLAGDDGAWEVQFPPMGAGGPHRLIVNCGEERVIRNDLLIGEVWLCSGQSNMQYSLREWAIRNAPVVSDAKASALRFFLIAEAGDLEPQDEVDGCWQTCSAGATPDCSAVAYFFARRIREDLGVPVGLIINALGDTEIASWMPRSALDRRESFLPLRRRIPNNLSGPLRPPAHEDRGDASNLNADPDLDDSLWSGMQLPGMWQLQGHPFSGSAWFRKTIELPTAWAGLDLKLEPGVLDDFDTTFFNGIEVGRTGPETKDSYAKPRSYRVPGSQVQGGRCVVALRVFDSCSLGGVNGTPAQMKIFPAGNPADAMALAGEWKFEAERSFPWLWSRSPAPTLLFNAILHPLTRFRIQGALWYQGESDSIRASIYKDLLAEMIESWRSHWGYEFPFLIVQLSNFMAARQSPGDSLWAELREAQRLASMQIPNSGLAVTIDAGETDDIHPKDKETVGNRLAGLALAKVYRREITCSGPIFTSFSIEGDEMRLHFEHAEGLRARGPLLGFALAGEDRNFRWGEARIDGSTVVVRHPQIPEPHAVRYAWQDNPPSPLENSTGLPASPFRTDSWPLLSESIGI